MKLIQRLAGNTFFLTLDWLAVTVLSFVFWIIVWKTLPPESAGVIATSLNMIILISTLGVFGMHATLTKLIAEYIEKRQMKRVASLIRFSNRFLIGINLVLAVTFFSVAYTSAFDFKIPLAASLVVAVGIVVWPITYSTTSILYGFQNMRRIFTTDLVANVLKVFLAAILIYVGLETLGPLAAIVASFITVIALRRDLIGLGKRAGNLIDKRHVIVKYAFPAMVASLSWAVYNNTPTIILTLLDSLKSSGLFAASISIVNPLAFIPTIISQALFPITSSLMVLKNHARNQAKLIALVLRYVFFISLPLYVLYLFFSKGIVLILARPEYLDAVGLIPIVGIAVLFQGMGHIFLSSLFAIRKTEQNRNVTMLTAASFLAVSLPATMAFGIMGLVWAFFISSAVFLGVSYTLLRRSLRFQFPWRVFGKISLSILPLLVLLLSMDTVVEYGIVPEILPKLVMMLPFVAVGMYLYYWLLKKLGFYSREDLTILKFAGEKMRPMKPLIDRFEDFIKK
jgi:O-antigen/teichoic acid export membrane protein